MVLLSSPTDFLEIAIFSFAVAAFVLAVRFFVDSRKLLQELFPGLSRPGKLLPFAFDRSGFLLPKTVTRQKERAPGSYFRPTEKNSSDTTKDEIRELRLQLQQQQQELAKALQKMSAFGADAVAPEQKVTTTAESLLQMEEWHSLLEEKEAEIQRLKQNEAYTQTIQERFEEVQGAFTDMQEKVAEMEKQSWQTAELSIHLDHAEQAQRQMETALEKKEERLREVSLENQRLRDAFIELEDKLSEANLQRQQLLKKVQLLEGLNTDMMQMAETNRKLKTEITRVAELESMLYLMTEGRK